MNQETIAAIATPPGKSALGIVRLSGPSALETAAKFLQIDPQNLKPRTAILTRAFLRGEFIDEVIALHFPKTASPTGEYLIEITSHGSPFILSSLLKAALESGAALAAPGEFTRRAFLNGKMDLSQAEAVCDLIRAENQASHRAALLQLSGGISKALNQIKTPLLEMLAHIEACLDHPEEDLPPPPENEFIFSLHQTHEAISNFAATYERGKKILSGPRICIAGLPNSGKSSLLNALLGRERAIVSEIPGTTRDTIEESLPLGEITPLLIDTAGIREQASDAVEREGIRRTQEALNNSDLALVVIDRSREISLEEEKALLSIANAAKKGNKPAIFALNKSDLPRRIGKDWEGISVSALLGEGIEELKKILSTRLIQETLGHEVLITNFRHHQALTEAAKEILLAENSIRDNVKKWEERAAFHLRQCLRFLGEVTGDNASEEVLNSIFSKFCVGK